jgi:DNA-3-methyladenine glycosylase II
VSDVQRHSAELPVLGRFSLRAAGAFGFGLTEAAVSDPDPCLRLAFPVDGGRGYAGAVLRQAEDLHGPVRVDLTLRDGAPAEAALSQVARTVSLDHDGAGFERIGRADPVMGELQRAHPGQRPVLFGSPYECAAWSIISARRPSGQGRRVREELSVQFGDSFELAGETRHAFPQPGHLLGLGDRFQGLNLEKLIRLRGVAETALEGALDVPRLHALGPDEAYVELQRIKGIGPFYAGLIVLRASGFADAVLPTPEPKVLAHAARFYGRTEDPTPEWFAALSELWRPFRTWAMVLVRLAGDRGTTLGGWT